MIEALIFYPLAVMILICVSVVAVRQHPFQQICALIATFVLMSILWLLMQAEFLGLLLIFVYVGAVMTLFLYIVMMINRDTLAHHQLSLFWLSYVGYIAIGAAALWAFHAWWPVDAVRHLSWPTAAVGQADFGLKSLGNLLFQEYWLVFECCAFLLLVVMMSCIMLVFRGSKPSRKKQKIASQISVTKAERLRLVKDGGKT